jgi:hypothetical protein
MAAHSFARFLQKVDVLFTQPECDGTNDCVSESQTGESLESGQAQKVKFRAFGCWGMFWIQMGILCQNSCLQQSHTPMIL